ncbi:MAG: DarT ssDNA thymidine ADP-ribosyltransferase family protein [Pseudolysinimonas sp.]
MRAPAGTRKPAARVAGAPHVAPYTLSTQRFFHVTHLRNLEAIMHTGEIRADVTPEIDVSSAITRELRAGADLADGTTVSEYVAFYASPIAARWAELRDGALGPHWSDEARAAKPAEFVLLAVPATVLSEGMVAADADAAAPATQFAHGAVDATQLLRRVRTDDPDFLTAEVLIPHAVSFDSVALIGVANDRVRDQVREMLSDAGGYAPKVAVYPPWFAAE